jgi:hypothetical protein
MNQLLVSSNRHLEHRGVIPASTGELKWQGQGEGEESLNEILL